MAEKEFKLQNDPLVEKLEKNRDFKHIYNLCMLILTTFLIDTLIHDYTQSNRYQYGIRLIVAGFNKFHIVILIWCVLNILALVCFSCFSVWAIIRVSLPPKASKFWDLMWLLPLIIYYILSLYGIQTMVKFFEFKPCSALLLLLEQVRLVMKQHAFVRTNAAEVLRFEKNSDQNFCLPSVRKYVFFLFAPTLIYRDEYPRTANIRWRIVLQKFLGYFYILWFLSLSFDILMVPYVENICIEKKTLLEVTGLVVGNGSLGIIVILSVFYLVLHSAQIVFAELLGFGDRMFYQEWWTANSFLEFLRKWNILVQDFLFFYVFKDIYSLSRNKLLSKVTMLMMSAIIHEWLAIHSLNLFFPIILMTFLLEVIFKLVMDPFKLIRNKLIILYLGAYVCGINISLYALEYHARQNCPLGNSSYYDFFKPRLFTCGCLT